MNIDRDKETYTEADVADVRARLVEHKNFESLSWPELARRIGDTGASTLSAFATGTYAGDNQKMAWRVNRYFLAEEDRHQSALLAPVVPGFKMTRTARLIMGQLKWAHGGEMVAVVGAPGMSKTSTFRYYQQTVPNAFLATMTEAHRAPAAMLRQVLRATGSPGKAAQAATLFDAICDKLAGIRCLIIVDEAQHLTPAALEQLRSIHDALGCGICLAGNETVLTRVQGGARLSEFAQLSSRVSWPQTYRQPHEEDVQILCEAWEVSDARQRELLKKIATQPGHLRLMTQVLKMATLQARAGHEDRTLSHLRDALMQLQQRPGLSLGEGA